MLKKLLLFPLLSLFLYASSTFVGATAAMDGVPKYGEDFKHFEYVNPKAPKGGSVVLGAIGTFDSLNPFILKGNSAEGLGMIYDTLMSASLDEPFSRYPLIAKQIEYPEDRSWVIFTIDERAKFSDGNPITSEDVKFSFDILIEQGHPQYKRYYENVTKAEILGKHRIKFHFNVKNSKELPFIMSELAIVPKHFWEQRDFSKTTLEIPVGSGAYEIESFDAGKSITYRRLKSYWAQDIPSQVGMNNFDLLRYDYYRDDTVALEAFKAGEYDFRQEYTSKNWMTLYTGRDFDAGVLKKETIKHAIPQGFQGFAFNTRRAIFQDRKVREALNYAFDFAWSNKNLFFGQYKRADTYFTNSEFASSGVPKGRELEILKSLKNPVNKEVLTQEFKLPETTGDGNIRANLKKTVMLLREANWRIKDGKMTNSKGEKLAFEVLVVSPAMERVVLPFKKNLELIGIDISVRLVDPSQYINRMRDFDFDMTVMRIGQSQSPGNEQRYFWSSESADTKGSRNYAGIKDASIDELIEMVVLAPNREELVVRTRALDRVLLWGWYSIPQWYSDEFRISYWDKFSHPKIAPKNALGFNTWWIDRAKEQHLIEKKPKLKR